MANITVQEYLSDWDFDALCLHANTIRRETIGTRVYLRGLIEFSNYCRRSCLYCGLRKDNKVVPRYRLGEEKIVAQALLAKEAGVDTIVLQSGEDPQNSKEKIARIISRVKDATGLTVTLSLGTRRADCYKLWKKAGADRYLLKHETSDPELYAKLHPGDTLQSRLRAFRTLTDLGYQAGSGFIIGLPGQTIETLINDVELVKELGAAMCGIGPFMPQQNTPLANHPHGDVKKSLFFIAILRSMMPHLHLPATTALVSRAGEGHEVALRAGANVIMPSFTPLDCREKYRIYDGKVRVTIDDAFRAIKIAGLTYLNTKGEMV